MTVEQNVLQQSAAQKHQQTCLNQLREITGINDDQILQQALKDSNGNLELAVAFLTAKNAKTPQQEETTYYQTALPGSDRYISVGSQADTMTNQKDRGSLRLGRLGSCVGSPRRPCTEGNLKTGGEWASPRDGPHHLLLCTERDMAWPCFVP
nr:ubiquitin carboxyl-terminal hydrolase 25-like [Equus caballus]